MATKTKRPKRKPKTNAAPAAAPSRAKRRPKRRNPSSAGMVMVPASMVGPVATAAKKRKGKGRRRPPQKDNPEGGSAMGNAMAAVGLGAAAAVTGLLGGYVLNKAALKSKGANVAANVALGAITGGGLGMMDRTAGTIVAHNYMVAAGQWLAAPGTQARTTPLMTSRTAPALAAAKGKTVATPQIMTDARRAALKGPEELEGVYADTMGELGAIHAETLGDVDDDMGAYEELGAIQAETFGDVDDVSELGAYEELGDADELADPFG